MFGMGTGVTLSLGSPKLAKSRIGLQILTGAILNGFALLAELTVNFMVKPNELLVTVSSTYYYAYTSVLST